MKDSSLSTGSQTSYHAFLEDILIVLVIYKAALKDSCAFNTLLTALKDNDASMNFLIYDNSPEPSHDYEGACLNPKIYYMHDKNNSGVSKAYNCGLDLAKKLNKKWLLLADQDTKFPESLFNEYYSSITSHPDIHLFVPLLKQKDKILSPCKFAFGRGRAFSHFLPGLHTFSKISILNSGMLLSVESFSKVGGFNEKIRLDFADFYFINKFKRMYKSFVVTNAVCIHELSSFEKDVNKVLSRFCFYCNGARAYSENWISYINLFFLAFFRALKLSLKYGKILFVNIFWRSFVLNQTIC